MACITMLFALVFLFNNVMTCKASRAGAFITYRESTECLDQLEDCVDRAWHSGCLYNPFYLRRMCPLTCNLDHCTNKGTRRVRHKGHATTSGTTAYNVLMLNQYKDYNLLQSHFKAVALQESDEPLILSSLGTGTYLGDEDVKTDDAVISAILFSVTHGWNVIDTASNYRWGRAEESIGRALDALLAGSAADQFAKVPTARAAYAGDTTPSPTPPPPSEYASWRQQGAVLDAVVTEPEVNIAKKAVEAINVHKGGDITRDMVFISTKAGFVTQELVDVLIQARKMSKRDVVKGMHSMHQEYIKASLELSLKRMHIEAVDLLYLHNAAEVQKPIVGKEEFMERLRDSFRAFEALRSLGKIMSYGLATWDSFRVAPGNTVHLSLEDVVDVAKEMGGEGHGFKWVQLPVNVGMLEAFVEPWQPLNGQNVTFMEAAEALKIGIMTSGPLGEGQSLKSLAGHTDAAVDLASLTSPASRLLQIARSTPGVATTLVGHKARAHVESNLQLSYYPLLTRQQFLDSTRDILKSEAKSKRLISAQ